MTKLPKKYLNQAWKLARSGKIKKKSVMKKAWELYRKGKKPSKKSTTSGRPKGKSPSPSGGSRRMPPKKSLTVSLTQAYALYKLALPSLDKNYPGLWVGLVEHALAGRWTDFNARLEWIMTCYGNDKMQILKGIFVALLGEGIKRYWKITKVVSAGPLKLKV